MNGDNHASKETVRAQMRARLRALTLDDRTLRSRVICERVAELPVWKSARVATLFEPMNSEPHITTLIEELRTRGSEIIIILPSAREHAELPITPPVDVVLVPGLAFTRDGGRLGRGDGFFDRFLAHRAPRAAKVGVCFNFQIVPSLPLESRDVKVGVVVSD